MNPILDVMIYVFAAIGAAATSYMALATLEFRKRKSRRPDSYKMWRAYEKNQAQKDA